MNMAQSGPKRGGKREDGLVHFLALAYLGSVFFASRQHWLTARLARPIIRMGQQSLPVFLVSMALSYLGLMAFDQFGQEAGGRRRRVGFIAAKHTKPYTLGA